MPRLFSKFTSKVMTKTTLNNVTLQSNSANIVTTGAFNQVINSSSQTTANINDIINY